MKRYWASRPDRNNLQYFSDELRLGRLRQGWGYSRDLDLRVILEIKRNGGQSWWSLLSQEQADAYRNYPFCPDLESEAMRQGDLVIVPNIPDWGLFTVVRIKDDEYHFEIDTTQGDYGHWRAVDNLTEQGIPWDHPSVKPALRTTLKCRSRIWRVDHIADNIEELVGLSVAGKIQGERATPEGRYELVLRKAKQSAYAAAQEAARREIETLLEASFAPRDLEIVVKKILESVYPGSEVEHCAGPEESLHGTDLLVKVPNPLLRDVPLLIAVQVKMHEGETADGVVQLEKAASYWPNSGKGKLVGLSLVTTAQSQERNSGERMGKISKEFIVSFLRREELIKLYVDTTLTGFPMWAEPR